MQNTTPTKEQWETAAVILAVLAALYAVVRYPLWWSWQRMTAMAIAQELAELKAVAMATRANTDVLVAHEEAIKAMGVALREIPRMSGVVGEMTTAVRRLDSTLQALHEDIRDPGQDIGEIRGVLQNGGDWKGDERRRKGRRQDDPPLSEEPT